MDVGTRQIRQLAGFDARAQHEPGVLRRRPLAVFHRDAGRHLRTSIAPTLPAAAAHDARHQRALRRERHHAADAGAVGGRGGARRRLHGVRGRQIQHLRDRHGRGDCRRGGDAGRRARRGRPAAVQPRAARRRRAVARRRQPLACRPPTHVSGGSDYQARAVARRGGPADGRRRRRSLRRLCGRRPVAPLERHARQPHAGHDGPADQPVRGDRRRGRLSESQVAWNWGVVGEQTPYVTGSFAQGVADVGRPATRSSADASHHADQPRGQRHRAVSVQPRATDRVRRRRPAHQLRSATSRRRSSRRPPGS